MPDPIQVPEEAVEAAARAPFDDAGSDDYWDRLHPDEQTAARDDARKMLTAAYPAIRDQVREEEREGREALENEAQAERATAHALGQRLRRAEDEANDRCTELEDERQELRMDLDSARAERDQAAQQERERLARKGELPEAFKALDPESDIGILIRGALTIAEEDAVTHERERLSEALEEPI